VVIRLFDLGPAAFFYIFKIFFLLFCISGFYSFLFVVLWWPVQWALVAFLVTWNKYDDDGALPVEIKIVNLAHFPVFYRKFISQHENRMPLSPNSY